MSIIQFLRIFWAQRLLILAAAVSCFVGGLVVVLVVPPVWKASSRILIDVAHADPVTGEATQGAGRGLVASALGLATDYSVAGRVVDNLGLVSDPNLIAQYRKRSSSDKRDFHRFAEQIIIDGTKAKILENSNILEITYQSNSAEDAKTIADAVRKALIDTVVDFKRQTAEANAEYFDSQALKAKAALDAAITAETDYERANGLAMADDKLDVESARLRAMASEGAQAQPPPPTMLTSSSAAVELAQVEGQIATEGKDLGPNNPALMRLKAQRDSLAATVAQERAAQRAAAGAVAAASNSVNRQVAAQKSKVVAESDKIGKLNQLQAEVDLRRGEFATTSARAAQMRQEALSTDVGLTPLASATVPSSPDFPNKLLILPGSLVLGLGVRGAGGAASRAVRPARARGRGFGRPD